MDADADDANDTDDGLLQMYRRPVLHNRCLIKRDTLKFQKLKTTPQSPKTKKLKKYKMSGKEVSYQKIESRQ